MTSWTADDLTRIADSDELRVAPARPDGTLRPPTPIWVVRDGDALFVRSYRGGQGRWFRAASATHHGHITADGIDRDVRFTAETDPATNARVDAAYRAKYGHYGPTYLDPMVAPQAQATTLRVTPN